MLPRSRQSIDHSFGANLKIYIDKPGRTQEQMILFHLFRVNYAEVPSDIGIMKVSLQLSIFFIGQVSH